MRLTVTTHIIKIFQKHRAATAVELLIGPWTEWKAITAAQREKIVLQRNPKMATAVTKCSTVVKVN